MKTHYRLTITSLLLLSALNFFSQAKIEIKESKQNFGFVKKGEVVKLKYEISNVGNEPLMINNIDISCSCTTAEFDKKPIPPQQKTVVTIIFDTKTVYDRQDRVVLLHSNDQKSPHKLRYKGVVLNK